MTKRTQSFWGYIADAPADFADLPAGTFSGTRIEWEALPPGFRREIARNAVKQAATRSEAAA